MLITFGKGYGEAWPGGPWIHSDNLPPGLPAGKELLHFRVSSDGRIVGQTGPENHARYWDGKTWQDLGPTSGVSIGAFHPLNGRVYVSRADGIHVFERDGSEVPAAFFPVYAGSQGIRWIDPDGTVHTGDATYSGPPLWEWTQVGDLRIGQGGPNAPDEGVRLVGPDKVLRAVNHDVARFIRCNAVGDQIAICYLRTTDGVNVRIQTTHSELLAQPQVVASQPPPVQPPPPKEPPVANTIPDIKQRVRAFLAPRLKLLPTVEATRANSFEAVNDCALDLSKDYPQAGLLVKTGSSSVRGRASDILLWDLGNSTAQVIDVVGDAEGAPDAQGHRESPTPAWSVKDIRPIAQWAAPYPASAPPVDPPADPPPSQPPSDPPPATTGVTQAQLDAALALLRADIQGRIDALATKPPDVPHGAAVEVSGSLSISDVLYARKVTWQGTIK